MMKIGELELDFENPKAGRAGWKSTGILRKLLLNLRPGGRVLNLLLDLLLISSLIILPKKLNQKTNKNKLNKQQNKKQKQKSNSTLIYNYGEPMM